MTNIAKQSARKPLRAIVIGAGMSGILAAIRLKESGDEVRVLEKATRAGGTWRENRYAGLTCDVPAHAYTYSFAPNPEWSRYFAGGEEIRDYFDRVIDDFGVRDCIEFGREVTELIWSEDAWTLRTADGEELVADVVIAATGVLHHPRVADIPGLAEFAGQTFHTARWPDDLGVSGKRVGLIGNGSTGVQIVTALAGKAAHLDHFQRSPQWIMPVEDFAYTEEDRALFREDVSAIDAIRYDEEYLGKIRAFNNALVDPDSQEMHFIEDVVLQNLEQSVADPQLREKLRPDYRAACKRLIYSPTYYEKVQHEDVAVVREAIERIEPAGVRTADGRLHPCDILIMATGFHADRFIRPTRVVGRGGVELDEAWQRRPTAYLAMTVPDFPNFFMLNGPTGPVGNFSLIDIAEAQWEYIDQLLELLRSASATQISPTHDAMADYERRRIAAAKTTVFATGCSSWYLDDEGIPQSWPWSFDSFFERMKQPDLSAFDIRAPGDGSAQGAGGGNQAAWYEREHSSPVDEAVG